MSKVGTDEIDLNPTELGVAVARFDEFYKEDSVGYNFRRLQGYCFEHFARCELHDIDALECNLILNFDGKYTLPCSVKEGFGKKENNLIVGDWQIERV